MGKDISYRNCKIRLANYKGALKKLAAAESRWEVEHKVEIEGLTQEEKSLILAHSATGALNSYGLALEVIGEHPEGHNGFQQTLINPSVNKAGSAAAALESQRQPRSKRRRRDTKLRINSTIRVRKEVNLKDLPASDTKPSEGAGRYHPKLPYTSPLQANLKPRYGDKNSRHSSHHYQTGILASSEGNVPVDTSRKLKDDVAWLIYIQREQDEAAMWDEEDRMEIERLRELEVTAEGKCTALRENKLAVFPVCVRRIITLEAMAQPPPG
ncbi:hypothetical protein NX059_009563 [Plenodomus lindquistii]|nr:hypothetical protein NX059_009563 [Plenodomus lindquistii]